MPLFIFHFQLTNFFAPSNSSAPKFGFDLISIHIQRGRDHGIPPYNDIRQACGLSTLDDFEDLNGIIRPDMVENFALVYE